MNHRQTRRSGSRPVRVASRAAADFAAPSYAQDRLSPELEHVAHRVELPDTASDCYVAATLLADWSADVDAIDPWRGIEEFLGRRRGAVAAILLGVRWVQASARGRQLALRVEPSSVFHALELAREAARGWPPTDEQVHRFLAEIDEARRERARARRRRARSAAKERSYDSDWLGWDGP